MTSPHKPQAAMRNGLQYHPVANLLFDEQNPRIPEGTAGKPRGSQDRIEEYFREEGTLEELVRSLADNGYFQTEPIIVTREGAPQGKLVVLEGNRRLAALRFIHDSTLRDLSSMDVTLTPSRRQELQIVPAIVVDRREDATVMIGYRHIGGLKFWDSDAKARWICQQVDTHSRTKDPFATIGRMVGLHRGAIRYYYLAGKLAKVASEEVNYNIAQLTKSDRFGVWLRAMENPDVRTHIGLRDVTNYDECQVGIKTVTKSPTHLTEVLDDIAKPLDNGSTRLGDSRRIPRYGEVLLNDRARKVFRQSGLEAAIEMLQPERLPSLSRKVLAQLERLGQELNRDEIISEDVREAVGHIKRIARGLRDED